MRRRRGLVPPQAWVPVWDGHAGVIRWHDEVS